MKTISKILLTFILVASCTTEMSAKPMNTDKGKGGYLFLHMKNDNYGKLFYSVSRDGVNWEYVNNGEIIDNEFLGHPTVTTGAKGVYYMIGCSQNKGVHDIILWSSKDLITWDKKILDKDAFDVKPLGYIQDTFYYGAPKIYYDSKTKQYIITWHAHSGYNPDKTTNWETMRTFYVLTKDFETFTTPARLFNFKGEKDKNMATIDVFIRREGKTYYAVIKDERWPNDYNYTPTGKTIRIATSKSLTGPYSDPGPAITDNWREAPTLVKSPDGKEWYLYAEAYPKRYVMYKSKSLTGSAWEEVKLNIPHLRHGWVHRIDEKTYQGIIKAYGNKK